MSRSAKNKLKVNPPLGNLPVLQYCAPDQLQIDANYQRALDTAQSQSLIRKIAVQWNWELCQPLFVARRVDGRLYVVDGQHRLAAAKLRGDLWQLPCVVASFTSAKEEAAAFVKLNQQRRPLTRLDLFKAALAAGDMEACQIGIALNDTGLRVASGSNNQTMAPGSISNVGGLQRCYRAHGVQILTAALEILAKAWPGEVLRFAGTVFPGLVALVIDQQPLAEPGSRRVAELAGFVGATSQADWNTRIGQEVVDTNANRRNVAERVMLAAWIRQQQLPPAPAARPLDEKSKAEPRAAPTPSGNSEKLALLPAQVAWCEQCDQRVSGARVAACQSKFCSIKKAEAA